MMMQKNRMRNGACLFLCKWQLCTRSPFVADAQPPRRWLLGFIPWFRPAVLMVTRKSKMGLGTIILIKRKLECWSRWLCRCSWFYWLVQQYKLLQTRYIERDAKNLYLAYHEGHGGYQHKSFLKKPCYSKSLSKSPRGQHYSNAN